MQPTLIPTDQPQLSALVELVASAEIAGDALLSTAKLVDALLDVRSDVSDAAVAAVDEALGAVSHRTVVPTDEAVELVSRVAAA